MTESMFTTRLSCVITGCGSNEMTCSRRSSNGFTRSTNGTTSPAFACGMTRIVRASTTRIKSTSTARTINAATRDLLFGHESGHALDLDDINGRSLFVHLPIEVSARRPLVAADAHAPAVRVYRARDDRLAADERVGAGARQRRHADMPA